MLLSVPLEKLPGSLGGWVVKERFGCCHFNNLAFVEEYDVASRFTGEKHLVRHDDHGQTDVDYIPHHS
jgi:hypothetical protein